MALSSEQKTAVFILKQAWEREKEMFSSSEISLTDSYSAFQARVSAAQNCVMAGVRYIDIQHAFDGYYDMYPEELA